MLVPMRLCLWLFQRDQNMLHTSSGTRATGIALLLFPFPPRCGVASPVTQCGTISSGKWPNKRVAEKIIVCAHQLSPTACVPLCSSRVVVQHWLPAVWNCVGAFVQQPQDGWIVSHFLLSLFHLFTSFWPNSSLFPLSPIFSSPPHGCIERDFGVKLNWIQSLQKKRFSFDKQKHTHFFLIFFDKKVFG